MSVHNLCKTKLTAPPGELILLIDAEFELQNSVVIFPNCELILDMCWDYVFVDDLKKRYLPGKLYWSVQTTKNTFSSYLLNQVYENMEILCSLHPLNFKCINDTYGKCVMDMWELPNIANKLSQESLEDSFIHWNGRMDLNSEHPSIIEFYNAIEEFCGIQSIEQ